MGGALVGQGVQTLGRGAGFTGVAALGAVLILDGLGLLAGLLTPPAAALGAATVAARLLAPALAPDGLGVGANGALLLVTAVAVGLLGPGAYSVDARLFGRREIVVPRDRGGA